MSDTIKPLVTLNGADPSAVFDGDVAIVDWEELRSPDCSIEYFLEAAAEFAARPSATINLPDLLDLADNRDDLFYVCGTPSLLDISTIEDLDRYGCVAEAHAAAGAVEQVVLTGGHLDGLGVSFVVIPGAVLALVR